MFFSSGIVTMSRSKRKRMKYLKAQRTKCSRGDLKKKKRRLPRWMKRQLFRRSVKAPARRSGSHNHHCRRRCRLHYRQCHHDYARIYYRNVAFIRGCCVCVGGGAPVMSHIRKHNNRLKLRNFVEEKRRKKKNKMCILMRL